MRKIFILLFMMSVISTACGNSEVRRDAVNLGEMPVAEKLATRGDIGLSPKIDPAIKLQEKGRVGFGKSTSSAGVEYVEAFIKSKDVNVTKDKIEGLGGEVHSIIGKILTAIVPSDSIAEIDSWPEVEFVEVGKPVAPKNDLGAISINADDVVAGSELPQKYNGEGVVVGIIDCGIDLTNPAFLKSDGTNRIINVWDQENDAGPGPTELISPYGTECNSESINNGTCPMDDTFGHGTHVAATAAGSDGTYSGVAPGADIIFVRYKSDVIDFDHGSLSTTFSTSVCDAANYIFQKAAALGKPAVINMSIGTHMGAHDGTSLFEACLDGLVNEATGRVLVASAGNENISENSNYYERGYSGLHAGYELTDILRVTTFAFPSEIDTPYAMIDIWQPTGSNLIFGIAVYNAEGEFLGWVDGITDGVEGGAFLADDNILIVADATTTNHPLNGKKEFTIFLARSEFAITNGYNFDLVAHGTGSFDAWLNPDSIGYGPLFGRLNEGDYISGDSEHTVLLPATASKVISVGAYTTRNEWDAFDGEHYVLPDVLNDIASFSSVGPSLAPSTTGQKPEIAAPGQIIVSAKSVGAVLNPSSILSGGEYALMSGTSMSAPFVTGSVALLMQANPNLTSEQIESYLTGTAVVDDFVGAAPNNAWGYGKLNTYAAVTSLINDMKAQEEPPPEEPVVEKPTVEEPPQTPVVEDPQAQSEVVEDSGSSGGGCSLITGYDIDENVFILGLVSLLTLLILSGFRKAITDRKEI